MLRIKPTLERHRQSINNAINPNSFPLLSIIYLTCLTASPADAAYVCKFEQDCTWRQRDTYVELSCKPKPTPTCTWTPDPTPPPPPPPPPPPKTAAEIEREQHVKFCKQYPAEIDLAVERCRNQALGYQSYLFSTYCSKNDPTLTFNFNLTFKGQGVNASRSTTISAADCRANVEAETKYYQSSCDLSGNEYRNILKQQCADVP